MNPQNRSSEILSRTFSIALTLGLLPLGLIGCASTPDLMVTSVTNGRAYHQGFVHAYASHNAVGDTDVVLVDDATEQKLSGQQPAAGSTPAAVRQVMHIRIIWTPTRDMKGAASNAAVKWYVIGTAQPQDLLEYTGTAFVSINQDDDGCTLSVSNALLKPSPAHGTLTDPVGLSRLEGKFTARSNPAKVAQILTDLRANVAAAKASTPAISAVTEGK